MYIQKIKNSIGSRISALSSKEKKVFGVLAFVLVCGLVGIINEISNNFSVEGHAV